MQKLFSIIVLNLFIAQCYAQISLLTPLRPYLYNITPVADSEIHLNQDDGGKVPYDYYAAFNCPIENTIDTVFYAECDSILLTVESSTPCYIIIYNENSIQNNGYQTINVDSYSNHKFRKEVTLHYSFGNSYGLNRIIAAKGNYVFKKLEITGGMLPFSNHEVDSYESENTRNRALSNSNCTIRLYNFNTQAVHTITGNLGNDVYYLDGTIVGMAGYNYYSAELPDNDNYCIFTKNSTTDTEIFLIGNNNEIIGHCNDYSEQSGHNWGTDARINLTPDESLKAVLLIPHSPYLELSSDWFDYGNSVFQNVNNEGNTDLFIGCKFPASLNYTSFFPYLLPADAIITDPVRDSAGEYNCHSWTVYPTYRGYFRQPYLTSSHTATSIAYYLCNYHGFTETGATEENSDVDIWEHLGIATHTSVKSYGEGAGGYSYGYGWESKMGHDQRIMHPRYALRNDNTANPFAYGHVVKHLIKSPNYNINDYVYENVNFNEEETTFINYLANGASAVEKQYFEDKWEQLNKTIINNYINNYTLLAHYDKAYQELASECGNSDNMLGLLLKKLEEGDALSAIVLIDATHNKYKEIAEEVITYERENTKNANGSNIIRTDISEATLYAKKILSFLLKKEGIIQNDDIRYSDQENLLRLTANNRNLQISFELKATSSVSICVEDLERLLYKSVIEKQTFTKGEHSFQIHLTEKGIYAVELRVNGKIYRKKISIY